MGTAPAGSAAGFDPSTITGEVIGPLRMPLPLATYGGGGSGTDNPAPNARTMAREAAAVGLEMEIHTGKTPELVHAADCCMAVSGSVSLELLYHTKPTVILYWVTRRAHWLAKRLINPAFGRRGATRYDGLQVLTAT